MIKVYTLAAGESARNYFIAEIKRNRQAKGYAYRDQLLVLPSGELMTLARKEGVAAVGLDYLASSLLNSLEFFKKNYIQLNRGTQELLVQRILEEKKENGEPFAYFESIIKKQGFIKAFTSLIGQLRRSSVTPEELEAAFEIWEEEAQPGNTEKNKDVVYVYQRYTQLLAEHRWYDLEGKYNLVINYLEQGIIKALPWRAIYISDFNALEPLQLAFLQKLAQYLEVYVGLNYEYPREKLYKAVDLTYSALAQSTEALEPELERKALLQYLVDNLWNYKSQESVPKEMEEESPLRLWQFTSRENEIRQVLTDIKAKLLADPELKPEQFCITMRKLNEYNGLSNIAEEYGVPLTLPSSISLGQQPLVELVLGLLQGNLFTRQGWLEYEQLLLNPLVKILSRANTESVEQLQESFYLQSVNHFYKVLELLAADPEQELFPAQVFMEDVFLQGLYGFVQALPERATVEEYSQSLEALMASWRLEQRLGQAHLDKGMELQAIKLFLDARNKLLDTLKTLKENYLLCQWEQRLLEKAEFIDLLRNNLEGQQLQLFKGNAEGVAVTPALTLQGIPYDYVYMLGLREGEFPSRNTEDWFYNDGERSRLAHTGGKEAKALRRKYYIFNKQEQNALTYDMGIEMPDTAASYAQENFIFGMAIAQARQELTLSWHCDDVAGASYYIEDVKKLLPHVKVTSWLAENKPAASWAEVKAKGLDCPKEYLEPQVLEALLADEKRSETGSVYNGRLQSPELISQIKEKKSFSASRLKTYAVCPFEYLVTKIWKEQGLRLLDEYLPPNVSGEVMHRVTQLLIANYTDKPISAIGKDREESQAILKNRLEACLNQACAEFGVDKTTYYETDREQLLEKLLRWLEFEFEEQAGERGFHPLAAELDMGYLPMHCLASDGETIDFLLNGKLDRIDVNASGQLFITDYKSSTVPSSGDLNKGLDLQMPVYILAAHELLKRKKELFALPDYMQRGAEPVTHANKVSGAGYLSFNSTNAHKVERFDRVVIEEKQPPKYNKNGTLAKSQPKNDKIWEVWEQSFRTLLADYVQGIYRGDFSLEKRSQCDDYCPLKEVCRKEKFKAGKEEADE